MFNGCVAKIEVDGTEFLVVDTVPTILQSPMLRNGPIHLLQIIVSI